MAGPGIHQFQNLTMQQVLAPQLQQSLQILQAPALELRNIVQQELQTNPVLEEEIDTFEAEERSKDDSDFQEEFERLVKLDEEWRDYMTQNVSYSSRNLEDEERRQFFFDSIASAGDIATASLGAVEHVRRGRIATESSGIDHRQH